MRLADDLWSEAAAFAFVTAAVAETAAYTASAEAYADAAETAARDKEETP
jgi:hypothetical protein